MRSEAERRADFLAMLADVLETPNLAYGDDIRRTRLWGSLTAFAVKVTVAQRCGRDLALGEIARCATAEELYAKTFGP